MGLLILYCTIAIIVCFVCSIMESVFLSITPSYVGLRMANFWSGASYTCADLCM